MTRRARIITLMKELNLSLITLREMRDEVEYFLDGVTEHNSEEVVAEAMEEHAHLLDACSNLARCLEKLAATTRTEQ